MSIPTEYQANYNMNYSTSNNPNASPDRSIVYPGSSFYVPPMSTSQTSPQSNYYYDSSSTYQQHAQFIQQSNSNPAFIPSSPQSQKNNKMSTCSPASIMIQDPPMLVASSSSTTTASTMSSSSVELLNEAFAKATSIPESFYPEFLQYSKEAYEQSTGGPNRKKQKRAKDSNLNCVLQNSTEQHQSEAKSNESEDEEENNSNSLTSTELRRQIHIQSEQKRRAQIKDGFEELRNELPTCLNKKMSKVALLHKTVQHIQHLKDTQMSILSELERLVHENEQLRKFQESILQKQALENMYTMTNM